MESQDDAGAERGKTSGAETARRTLRVLEGLTHHQPIKLQELADSIGLNKSITYRLLRVLQEEDYAERIPAGGYRIGRAFAGLAAIAAPHTQLYAAARPILRNLVESTAETVTLHRRVGDLSVLVFGLESEQHTLRQVAQVGDAGPLVRGCGGNAILSRLPENDVDVIMIRAGLTSTEADRLRDRLATIADLGYALSCGANHVGVQGIAAPIPFARGETSSMSLVISGPEQRWTEDRALEFVPSLLEAAAAVGRHLDALEH
ncbi:IclR family transcriptional regulator [Amycolatopsis sp. lyj-90]|uniref:IclR family transcriptional regulator n=1 Tax=Amycolatopsis sp. lyj-90 TaxID=2789285 RepID=UPI00397CA702